MERIAIDLPDGSVVLAYGAQSAAREPAAGTLDFSQAASDVAVFLGGAVGGGATFELVKAAALNFWRKVSRDDVPPPATADEVRDAVETYLLSSGYASVTFSEIKLVPGDGWTATGAADGRRFRATSDVAAILTHVRIR